MDPRLRTYELEGLQHMKNSSLALNGQPYWQKIETLCIKKEKKILV